MQFTFNEGHIQLPSQWQDQSMQVLVSTDMRHHIKKKCLMNLLSQLLFAMEKHLLQQ